jgi:tripartite-type tricarboxylate transporter receptor subunit TctC
MRTFKLLAAAAAFTALSAHAQTYPAKPVRILVPFSPGGATDIVTRVLGQKLNEVWGQTVIVDNRAGASGNIAAELASKSPADGYTLFMTSGSIIAANQYMFRKLNWNPEKDLVPITIAASGPQILAVHPTFRAKTVKDFIALAKANPRTLNFGSAGFGSQTHLAAENFVHAAQIDVVHIPYKGEGPALIDLVAGQIFFATPNLSAAIGFVKQGKLRALGITSKTRSDQVPDVPPVSDTLPGFENLGWFGLMAPANTPKAVIDRIHQDSVKALQTPDTRKRFEDLGMVPVGNTPAAFDKQVRDERLVWAKVIRDRKLQVD